MFSTICNAICIFAILYSVNNIIKNWKSFPDRVPIHFNIMGKPDNYGSKYFMLLYPVMSFALFIMYILATTKTNIPPTKDTLIYKIETEYMINIIKVTTISVFPILNYYITDLILNKKETLGKIPIIIVFSLVAICTITAFVPILIPLFVK